jgi:hypothetical protein
MSDRYERWREKAEKHDLNHTTLRRNGQKDFSCTICYQPSRIMKKEFRRFWKWYRNEIPEVKSYSRKAEENFEELMNEDFSVKIRTGTERAKLGKRLVWLMESMRYERSPKEETKDIGEMILRMIVASNKFTKRGKEAKDLYECLTGESEGYSTDNSLGDEHDTSWYKQQKEMIAKHYQDCGVEKDSDVRDVSCRQCYPVGDEITENSDFLEFWKWYQEIMNAEIFSGKTVKIFNGLREIKFEDNEERNEKNFAELTLLILSVRYTEKPKYNIWEISSKIIGILSVSSNLKIGIQEAIEKLQRDEENANNGNSSEKTDKDMSEGSKKSETYDEKENRDVITIYVNNEGIFKVTGTGKEIRIKVDTEDFGNKLSGEEVAELCSRTKEEMEPIFEEIDRIIRELREKKDEITLLEELKNNTEENYNRKGKGRETYEDEITEFKDHIENVINMGDFDISKTSGSEKGSEKEFGESEEESQELESEEVENYSENESEEELVIVNPPANMALNIIRVEPFNGENIDAEEWLQKFIRAAAVNNWADDVKVNFAAAHLEGSASEWFEKDRKLQDANGGRINSWDDQTDANSIARSFVTKFKAEFISEEVKDEKKREWYFQWERMKQLPGENMDAYTKRYQKMLRNAERVITEEEKIMKYQEGLLPMYYANATVGTSTNLAEAIKNAKNSERGILRQLFPEQRQEQTNKIYQEMQKKDVKSEEVDDLTKMMKELKIQLMKRQDRNSGYEKRDRGYNNSSRREVTCYKCGKKGHYSPDCEEEEEIKCYKCGKNGHIARACRNEGNQTKYGMKNRERNLNYIGIHSSEGRRIREDESSSDEDEEKRVYPISTRSQKYGNASTNIRRDRTNNFQQRKMDKLAENDRRRLNSESRKELELRDEESEDEVMTDTGNKRLNGIRKALEGKRKKNKCKRCGGIGHFVPDCPTLTEKEKKWYNEERERNREKRKGKSRKYIEFEEEFDILSSPCGLTVGQAMKYIPAYKQHVKRVFKKGKQGENVNYIKSSEGERSSAMRCNAGIEGRVVEVIIDSGAEVTAMSRGLMEKLGYEIEEPSNIIIKSANDQRNRSLGKINNVEILLEGEDIVTDVEVIENADKLLILGNDWIKENVRNIDIENEEMKIRGKYGTRVIPIEFTKEIDEEEYESEEDIREAYC